MGGRKRPSGSSGRLLQGQVPSEEQAVDIAAPIEARRRKIPETALLLRRLKRAIGSQRCLGDLASDMTVPIAQGPPKSLTKLEHTEISFTDPARAVREMEKGRNDSNDRPSAYKKKESRSIMEDTRKHRISLPSSHRSCGWLFIILYNIILSWFKMIMILRRQKRKESVRQVIVTAPVNRH
jgi:hypothetical protein